MGNLSNSSHKVNNFELKERMKQYYLKEGIDIIIDDNNIYAINNIPKEKYKLNSKVIKSMKIRNNFSCK